MNGCVAKSFHLNVSKTHYMIFTPKNKIDFDVRIHCVSVERVYATKFLGVFAKNHANVLELLPKPGESCTGPHSSPFIIHSLTHIFSIATIVGKQLCVHLRRKEIIQKQK